MFRAFHYRSQIPDKRIRRFVGAGVSVILIGSVRGAGLGSHHGNPGGGRHPQIAVIARLELPHFFRVRMRKIEITAQHGHVQVMQAKYPTDVGGQSLCQGGGVRCRVRDALCQRQMDAGEALLTSRRRSGFQRPLLLRAVCVHIVKTNPNLHGHFLLVAHHLT